MQKEKKKKTKSFVCCFHLCIHVCVYNWICGLELFCDANVSIAILCLVQCEIFLI